MTPVEQFPDWKLKICFAAVYLKDRLATKAWRDRNKTDPEWVAHRNKLLMDSYFRVKADPVKYKRRREICNKAGKKHRHHKRPVASHNMSIEEEQKAAFHFTNYQPLSWGENLRKGSFYNGKKWHYNHHQNA